MRGTRFVGTDCNPHLIEWCQRSLPFATFAVNSTLPPLDYRDDSFDFIYAFSVFTHLAEADEESWLLELWRVLRPGGYALLTTHGKARLGILSQADQERCIEEGFVVGRQDVSGTNSCATFHLEDYIRRVWGRVFRVVSFVTDGAKDIDQDATLLQKHA